MANPYRRRIVTSVRRAYSRDPLERIDSLGGTNPDHSHWNLSQAAAINLIEAGTDSFAIRSGDQTVNLVVVASGGEKYLQTERERTHPDDLLNLLAGGALARG